MSTVDRGGVNAFTTAGGQVLSTPWVRKYFAGQGQCLAFLMTKPVPNADLKLVVISPDPSIRYRNDDSGGTCFRCPAVQIESAPLTGYYTVIATLWSGDPVTTDFLPVVDRKDNAAIYCPKPTPPF